MSLSGDMNNRNCHIFVALIVALTMCSPSVFAESAEDWYEKGVELYDLENYSEALEAFNHAIEINPNDDGFWYYKGLSLFNLKMYDEALVALKQGLEIKPSNSNIWQIIGLSLDNLNRYDEAIEAFDSAIDNAGGDETIIANGWNGKGIALYDQGKNKEALIAFDITLKIDPEREHVISLRDSIIEDLMNEK